MTDDDDDDELSGIRRGFGRRLWSTGKIAASAGRLAARRVVGATGAADGRIGEALANEMDQMKGMAMKVGQILSYFDGVLPEETHKALVVLQRGAKPVAFGEMAAVLEAAFGEPIDALFEDFVREPIASASIGQVYRARYLGQDVAVKVQYPGIRETIAGDFSRLQKLASVASLATSVDGDAVVRELKQSFGEECDYLREAENQAFFRAAFAGEAGIVIPQVVAERTTETVLTSSFCRGKDLYTFAKEAEQERRNDVGLRLARFAFQSLFGLGTVNADPHPGNYLFPPSGDVVFLDFGCVRRIDADLLAAHRRLVRVVIDGERARFREALLETGMVPKERGFDFDLHWDMLRHELSPYLSARFRFTKELIAGSMKYSSPSNPNLRRLAIPPQWIWIERLTLGLHAVLARLAAEGDFAAGFREALESRP